MDGTGINAYHCNLSENNINHSKNLGAVQTFGHTLVSEYSLKLRYLSTDDSKRTIRIANNRSFQFSEYAVDLYSSY